MNTITKRDLERMLLDEAAEPKAIPFYLLAEITNGFSDELEIGRGGFAVVYKAMLENRYVAVKRLSSNSYLYEKEFHREIECLMKVKHKNIVQFLGYCADTHGKVGSYNGKFVIADLQHRLLCFEYLSKGSLHDYIEDASRGLEWRERYKIIKGICEGLCYLHQQNILHLDLKPDNILLDENMQPKITDFGLSRCFEDDQTRIITSKVGGTRGYLAPEFNDNEITYKFDLYSLGVIIIEILTGRKGYQDIEDVLENWSKRLQISHGSPEWEQIEVCAEIAIECTEFNPKKRPPSVKDIIDRLDQTESDEMINLPSNEDKKQSTSSEMNRGVRMARGKLEVLLVSSNSAHYTDHYNVYYVLLNCHSKVQKSHYAKGAHRELEWNQTFVFNVSGNSAILYLKIVDYTNYRGDLLVGEACIPLEVVIREGSVPPAVHRVVEGETYRGDIKIALTFTPAEQNEECDGGWNQST